MRKLLFTTTLLLQSVCASLAQQESDVEMADAMRSSGKIYVVVGVIVLLFLGLLSYILLLEKRLRKLERQEK